MQPKSQDISCADYVLMTKFFNFIEEHHLIAGGLSFDNIQMFA